MIKRVCAVLLVVAFLVAPCLALSDLVILNSFDGWSQNNAVCTDGYFSFTGTGDATYDLPRSGDPNRDFSVAVSAYLHRSGSEQGDLGLRVFDTSGQYLQVYVGLGYVGALGNYLRTSGGDLIDSVIHTRSLPDFVSSSYCISRVGDEFTLSFGGYTRVVSVPDFGEPAYVCLHTFKGSGFDMPDLRAYDLYYSIADASSDESGWAPCTINVYDADTRLPLSGAWDYYIVIQGADSISGSASGASKVVNLPATSILQPHRIRVTKEGYVQVPEHLAFNVPAGGREIPVYLRSTTAPPEEGNVWLGFACTDADTGSPVPGALVNLDGSAQYTSASGYVRFQVPMNSSHKWVASSSSHWPMGGDITVGTVDLNVPVELVRKTSDLPRPPLPELPNFPVIHPSLDPAGFRMKILDVPVLGGLASPLLDTMDALAAGLDDIAQPVLDFATAPADKVVEVLEGVGDQLTESVATYTDIAGVFLGSVGKLLAVFPPLVIGLVTYNLVLDLVYLLLRGGL